MGNAASTAMGIANSLDDLGKPAWIALLVLTFILFWPLGLALLAYLIWSGRMGCHGNKHWRERMREGMHRWQSRDSARSTNSAFDDYREETLKRLEEEEREFRTFLDRLRRANDKAEFDEFMAERKHRPEPPMDGAPQAA
jgi:hypothetical protein